jgi:hypothetical protein
MREEGEKEKEGEEVILTNWCDVKILQIVAFEDCWTKNSTWNSTSHTVFKNLNHKALGTNSVKVIRQFKEGQGTSRLTLVKIS